MEKSPIIWQFLALTFLLALSAFFSGSETALTSLGKLKTKSLIEKRKILFAWLNNPDNLLATILVGNNIANISASVLLTFILLRLFGETTAGKIGAVSTGVMTFLILIFGEIAPKTYARVNAEKVALRAMKLLIFFSYLFSPLVKFFLFVAGQLIRLCGGRRGGFEPFMTEDEIKGLINLGEEEGVLEKEKKEMIEGVFEFGEKKVREVMVPRPDIVAIEIESDLEEAFKLAVSTGHSRILVFKEKIDDVVGVLYVKDLLGLWPKGEIKPLSKLMQIPYFVPEAKKVDELLREFKNRRIHIAVVVDEYGGTVGLVTIEDLIEEIVGEIENEYGYTKKEEIIILADELAVVRGRADIGEINERFDISFPEKEGVETIAGAITDYLGYIPQKGEDIFYKNLKISIIEADQRQIIKVRIAKISGDEVKSQQNE
ncbi:MAG: Magnesium and cobalt efflux protein CorC [Syntrophomonadaceae bacterium]|nr:Magnesium and cobalt efflux protein CorC [Bacillota bacterium]